MVSLGCLLLKKLERLDVLSSAIHGMCMCMHVTCSSLKFMDPTCFVEQNLRGSNYLMASILGFFKFGEFF